MRYMAGRTVRRPASPGNNSIAHLSHARVCSPSSEWVRPHLVGRCSCPFTFAESREGWIRDAEVAGSNPAFPTNPPWAAAFGCGLIGA